MNSTMKIKTLITYCLVLICLASCSTDDSKTVTQEDENLINMLLGEWQESNVTFDGVTSTTQVICNGERELFTFSNDTDFSERTFGDTCNSRVDDGMYQLVDEILTLQFTDGDIDIYTAVELNETTLRFNFNDGGVIVEETYTKN